MSEMTAIDVLNKAADWLMANGWTQRSYCRKDVLGRECRCAMGAINAVAPTGETPMLSTRLQAIEVLAWYLTDGDGRRAPYDEVAIWNDKPGRRRTEVVEVMRAAARAPQE